MDYTIKGEPEPFRFRIPHREDPKASPITTVTVEAQEAQPSLFNKQTEVAGILRDLLATNEDPHVQYVTLRTLRQLRGRNKTTHVGRYLRDRRGFVTAF